MNSKGIVWSFIDLEHTPETPDDISKECFRSKIRQWKRIEDELGADALKPKHTQKVWTPEEKLEFVAKVIAGASIISVALNAGINDGMLFNGVTNIRFTSTMVLYQSRKVVSLKILI